MLLTRSPLTTHPKADGPFDLHVLSTPPAFVLSQDQTLQQNQKETPPQQHTSGQQTPAKTTHPTHRQAQQTPTNKQSTLLSSQRTDTHQDDRQTVLGATLLTYLASAAESNLTTTLPGCRSRPISFGSSGGGASRPEPQRGCQLCQRPVKPGCSLCPGPCASVPTPRPGYPRSLACRRFPAASTVPSNCARGTS